MPTSLVIRGGTVFDGTGSAGRRADVAIDGDRIVGIGDIDEHVDAPAVDATGLAVCPGFINVLSHAWGSLQVDGSGASDTARKVIDTATYDNPHSLAVGIRHIAVNGELVVVDGTVTDRRPGRRLRRAR